MQSFKTAGVSIAGKSSAKLKTAGKSVPKVKMGLDPKEQGNMCLLKSKWE